MFPGEILRTTALVQIDPDLPLGLTIDGGIVKITIQAKTGPLPSPQLLIFDHRLGVINSAEALLGLSADEHAFPSERFRKIFQKPAIVAIYRDEEGCYRVHLHEAQWLGLSLFSVTTYSGNAYSGFDHLIDCKMALWAWTSRSVSVHGSYWDTILVALTDYNHQVGIEEYKVQNKISIGREITTQLVKG